MGGHSETRVEINSEVTDNGHHTIKKTFVQLLLLIRAYRMALWGNMSFPHKEKHTCDICISSLWGNVCVEDDLVGKKSYPHKDKHTSVTSDNSFYCFHYCAPPLG